MSYTKNIFSNFSCRFLFLNPKFLDPIWIMIFLAYYIDLKNLQVQIRMHYVWKIGKTGKISKIMHILIFKSQF